MEEIRDSIKAVMIFENSIPSPYLFAWQNRTYKITEIHSYYTARNGEEVSYFWSVSANGNIYALEWNSATLEWFLSGIDEEHRARS